MYLKITVSGTKIIIDEHQRPSNATSNEYFFEAKLETSSDVIIEEFRRPGGGGWGRPGGGAGSLICFMNLGIILLFVMIFHVAFR